MTYPKRLIEVDLPIRRISAHARREKSIRHGHISTLHIWWARRPLAACRAVICAALWPDPADADCPKSFLTLAEKLMREWSTHERQALLSTESRPHFEAIRRSPSRPISPIQLRAALLDFIADFANWDNSTVPEFLATSRALTQAAHEALGGAPGTRPLVVDPFAGGGSIPLEALRVGADAFASDLNPVPVLLNKVVLEYIPRFANAEIRIPKSETIPKSEIRSLESEISDLKSAVPSVGRMDEKTGDLILHGLAEAVRYWGDWIKREAEKELAKFYPKDPDGATPIAYLWARTIQCEGPGCGAEVPLIRSLWLAKKANRSVALQLVPRPRAKRVDFQIIVKQRGKWVDQSDLKSEIANPQFEGTVRRGSATCPCCGYTTPVARVREQLKTRHGGANDARLMCVVSTRATEQGRFYRLPTETDGRKIRAATSELQQRKKAHSGPVSLVPDEKLDMRGIRHTWAMIYGLNTWEDFFTRRQALALTTIARLLNNAGERVKAKQGKEFAAALQTCLAMVLGRQTDALSASVTWTPGGEFQGHTFARQALAFVWDFAEVNPWCDSSGNFMGAVEWVAKVCATAFDQHTTASTQQASATHHPLPDDSAHAFITDPPYYDAVPYSYLSDFFYVWLRRAVGSVHTELLRGTSVPKDEEVVVDRPHELSNSTHDIAFYERELAKAFGEGRRVLRPDGVGTIVFASKTTASWEAILKAVVDAGWIITGSWPIDTEREARVSAQGQARLASSVHLVCRPREDKAKGQRLNAKGEGGALQPSAFSLQPFPNVGDWRDVLQELPRRIHDWMPRLADEGVVGADAIFACLGPALEIFSRYARVEKASGDPVSLKEYLEQVWAAVAKEALTMIFTGADATGFEEDARLTAMWLWTLKTNVEGKSEKGEVEPEEEEEEKEEGKRDKGKGGFVLEFDAARKIAQGLGAHLEGLTSLVEVSGETARLLPVSERARALFGKDNDLMKPEARQRAKRDAQMEFFAADTKVEVPATASGPSTISHQPSTFSVLDRVHQSMILFAAGRSEALKRFLVEDGAGNDQRFWRLAQALSALYPPATDEKRWVDGVLAKKKGLGF